MNKEVRLSGIAFESLVNGPGLRRVIFAQGCIHNCKGCFNPDTHDLKGGQVMDMDKIIKDIKNNPLIKGVTFSGGDCLEQADKFAYMGKKIKELGLNIWCYTGYTYEYILQNKDKRAGWDDLLDNIDVLVDGKFEEDKQDSTLRYKGSSNQRIIDIKESLKSNKVVTIEY
ncbi:anaerobic ribonucleoside-triphosphate reductase activating protein [Clostridiaceae bacterium UIB06]|nr:anaerobic ribonucleoside-triphosphate reductase activating protein [Clostridiaceae bacterium UIB06]